MSSEHPPYMATQHGPYFFELAFTDFKRATIDEWLRDSERRVPQLLKAPWIRVLCDLREIYAFSAYAVAVFERALGRPYASSNIRVAFVVGQSLFDAQLEYSTGDFFSLHRKSRDKVRFFRDHEQAFLWLSDGIPSAAQESATAKRPEEE